MMKRINRPVAGEKWRYTKTPGIGFVIEHPTETRTVVDRTLGGSVVYVSGRFTRHALRIECTIEDWVEWQKTAKQVGNP